MSKNVLLPNSRVMQFPDNASTAEMNIAINEQFPELFAPEPMEAEVDVPQIIEEKKEPRNPPLGMVFGRAWDQSNLFLGRGIEAYGELTNNQKDIEVGRKWIEANKKELDEWDKKFKEGGYEMLTPKDIKGLGLFGNNEAGAWDFIQQSTAASLPYLLQIIPAAVVGGRAAPRIVPKTAKNFLQKYMSPRNQQRLVSGSGSIAGAFLPSYALNIGINQDEIKTRGGEDLVAPGIAFKYGAGMALLDSLALGPVILGSLTRYGVKPTLKAATATFGKNKALSATGTAFNAINKVIPKGRLGKAGLIGVSQAGSEGLTERLQEILTMEAGYDATGKRVSVEERANRLLEATFAGMAAGFGFGAPVGALTGGSKVPAKMRRATSEQLQQQEMFDQEEVGGRERFGPSLFEQENIIEEEFIPNYDPNQLDLFDAQQEIKDSSIPFQQEINNNIESIRERVLQLFNAGVPIESQIINTQDIQEINKTSPEQTKEIIDTLVSNNDLKEVQTSDGEVVYSLSDKRQDMIKDDSKKAAIMLGEPTNINDKKYIKDIKEKLTETDRTTQDNFDYITWEGDYKGKKIIFETDIESKPGLIKPDGKEGPSKDTQILRVEVEDKDGNRVELPAINYTGKKTDPVINRGIKQVAEYYETEIPSLVSKQKLLGEDFKLDPVLEKELDAIEESRESLMSKGQRGAELVEPLMSKKIITGSIFDSSNDKELLEAFGDEEGVKKFRSEVKYMQDTQRTFGNVDATGTPNRSRNQRTVKDMEYFDPKNPKTLSGHAARLNLYETYMNGTYQTAMKFPAFARMYKLLEGYNIIQRQTQAELTDFFRAYANIASIDSQSKARLDRFIIVANILGTDGDFKTNVDETSASVVYPLDYKLSAGGERFLSGQEAVDASLGGVNDPSNPNYITIGKPLTLNQSETEAFMMLKRGFKEMADKNIEVTVKYKDGVDSTTYADVVERWKKNGKKETLSSMFYKEADFYDKKGIKEDKKTATEMRELAEFIQNLEEQSIENYFPNVREGDGIFRIVWKGKKDGKEFKEVVYRTDIVQPLYYKARSFPAYTRKWVFKNLPSSVFETYPEIAEGKEVGYTYEFLTKAQMEFDPYEVAVGTDQIQALIVASDQQLRLQSGSEKGAEAFQEYITKVIHNINVQRKLSGLNQHYQKRKGIPGYVTPINIKAYVPNSFSIYSSQVARYFARASTEKAMDAELELLKSREPSSTDGTGETYSVKPFLGSHSLYTFGKKAKDFTLRPQSAWSMLKSIAFYGFLGGNLSSIMINMMQGHVTAVMLASVYGPMAVPEVIKNTATAGVIAFTLTLQSTGGRKGLYLPSLNSSETLVREDAEILLAKWKKLGLKRDQYQMLADLAQRGTIGKINTEALSGNSDIQMQYFMEKFGVGAASNPVFRTTAQGAVKITNLVGAVYAYGELVNRIAAGLSAYNLSKKYGTSKMNNFNSAEVLDSNLEDTEEGYTNVANAIVNMTQFSLDAYNRPLLARQLGGVPVQFLPFVKMMIDIHGNALMGRYGGTPQLGKRERWTAQEIRDLKLQGVDTARRGLKAGDIKEVAGTSLDAGTIPNINLQLFKIPLPNLRSKETATLLISMTMAQLFLGGAYGMPYADDLNEVLKFLSKKLGKSELDVKLEMIAWMNENDINENLITLFEEGYANRLTGLSVNHRFSLNMINNVIRNMDNPAAYIGGPAFSFAEGYVTRAQRYAQNGDVIKLGLSLVPFALTQNIAKGIDAWEDGVYTEGNTSKLPPGDLQTSLMYTIGFQTKKVTESTDQMRKGNYFSKKYQPVRADFTKQLAKLYFEQKVFRLQGNIARAEEAREKVRELRKKIREHDRAQVTKEGVREYEMMINPNGTIYKNAQNQANEWFRAQKDQILNGGSVDYSRLSIPNRKFRSSLKRRNIID